MPTLRIHGGRGQLSGMRTLVEGRLRRRLVPLVASEGILVVVLGVIVWHSRGADRLDRDVASALYSRPGNAVRGVASAVTFFGSPMAVAVGALLVTAWAWWRFHDRLLSLFCPLAVGASALAEKVLKSIIARPRPPTAVLVHEVDFSYPSGHVTGAAALALATILLLWAGGRRRNRTLSISALAVYAVAVAVSRLVLGVHYLSDVVGAAALASAGVLVVGWLCSMGAAPLSERRAPLGGAAHRRPG